MQFPAAISCCKSFHNYQGRLLDKKIFSHACLVNNCWKRLANSFFLINTWPSGHIPEVETKPLKKAKAFKFQNLLNMKM
ncbi:hypothetical protein T10_8022 [Trichinella papuae]|uniref:Uncharacterized protein n=1 Tax=Trichinella papuae TaxID=268474 RepID=A0A0V1MFZ2_9BILA|nr:hypothetical protein T10_8022 [Trichinella papuae]